MELKSSVSGVNALQTEQCTSTSSDVKGAKKLKCYCSYLTFGFTYTGNEEYLDGLCLLCNKTFSNTFLAPASLKRKAVRHTKIKTLLFLKENYNPLKIQDV